MTLTRRRSPTSLPGFGLSHRISSGSVDPTNRWTMTTTPMPGMWDGCGVCCSTRSTCGTSPGSARTGVASSDFDSSANTPNAFARLRSQHRLPDGTRKMGEAWWKFHDFVKAIPDLPIGTLMSFAVTQPMTPEVIAAYMADE